ncbi:MAG: hypothetical protein EB056_00165 [Verrucomicrobia bacterium]|nr:hypothetical protein [Verrucomicrobiota bacterium]
MKGRRLTPEILDSLPPNDPGALASRQDLQRLHSALGQIRLWRCWLRQKFRDRPPSSLVDLGSGDGHLITRVLPLAFPSGGGGARLFFVDPQPSIPESSLNLLRRQNWLPTVVASGALEWAREAPPTELILSNLFLHHLNHWSRMGCRLLSMFHCHPVTLHDARVSVEAGFHGTELSALWPQESCWQTTEFRRGLFNHFFSAEKSP